MDSVEPTQSSGTPRQRACYILHDGSWATNSGGLANDPAQDEVRWRMTKLVKPGLLLLGGGEQTFRTRGEIVGCSGGGVRSPGHADAPWFVVMDQVGLESGA
jgi:hypothetical protein